MAKFGPFIVGGIVGAVAGLLYAPRAGVQTRALVSEKVNAVWGEASDFAQSAGVAAPGVVIQDVAANAQAVAQNVQAKVQGVAQVGLEGVLDEGDGPLQFIVGQGSGVALGNIQFAHVNLPFFKIQACSFA